MRRVPVIYQVRVTRTEWVDVLVESADPVEARDIAQAHAAWNTPDVVRDERAVAYSSGLALIDRFWRGDLKTGGWVYPETSLEFTEGAQT